MPDRIDFITTMAKHLPPSASELRLLDIGGATGETLRAIREDLQITVASLDVADWDYESDSYDAVMLYDTLLKPTMLDRILAVMRSGGRFICVLPFGYPDASYVEQLEAHDYVRILVESAMNDAGVLIRGEKVHTTDNTLERVQQVAQQDADLLDLTTYRGRYVHLLVIQTPNKPVWKLAPDERIEWHAAAIEREGETYLLAFSSLPKSVSFMQPAVMQGKVNDVNKVGKFSKATAQTWELPVLLNPNLESITDDTVVFIPIDPDTAEAPDE